MRILVTGHQGYIGTVLVPMLIAAGHEVVGLDSGLFQQCTFGGPVPDVSTILKDVRDVELADVEGFDAVVHLAGLSNDPLGELDPPLTFAINTAGSLRLACLAKQAGVRRFVFSSSCSSYGAAGDAVVDEAADLHPVTPYGESKVRAESGLVKLANADFTPILLRNATAYGVSPRLRFDLVLNNLTAWAYTTGLVYLKSDGSPWRPLVHIEDISRAIIAVLHAPQEAVHNAVFNVGMTEENYQIRALAEIVRDTVPGTRIEYAQDAGPDKRNYRVSFDKLALTLPAFKPRWNARLGVQQLYDTYRKVGLCLEDFEGPRYKRVAHIQRLLQEGHLAKSLRWN
jgi:nucleoside-diphosphate-sugar epimerase